MSALMLRTCAADMTSHSGFVWPESGPIEAPDWNPEAVCGGGLHGLLWGEGAGGLLSWSPDARWLVVEVEQWVDLDGKVKAPRGAVLFCGDRLSATAFLAERAPGRAIVGGTATAGDYGTATAGDYGMLCIRWWDGSRYRLTVGYVGEDGIKPNTAYRCDNTGRLVEVTA
jgi:hypothetical protein